ncbi:MAG TPA: hypothetical protein VFO05_01845 [Candidatus Limnocylindrales bacterium]|nr:hypothetical protein [Candidatus Limnocylindrales bacterium]
MELSIALGIGGWIVLVGASLLFGVAAQLIGETRTGFEWVVDGVAFAIGALVASEFILAWQATGPVFDGLALVPALIGGLLVGIVVEVLTRFVTGGTYTHGAMSA